MGLSWMAWTWPTAAFFVFIALAIASMGVWEYYQPGGNPRRGVFGLDTTRGDRLFISLLGSAFIFLICLAVQDTQVWRWLAGALKYITPQALLRYNSPLWGGLALALVWLVFVFRKV
jgi:predicted small integral membrane protein